MPITCVAFIAAGQVSKIHLLGDFAHATRIAFVEFTEADSAIAALNCSGALLGRCMTLQMRHQISTRRARIPTALS